jgi:LPXTG-motif cell wall-anchored protein
MRRYRLPRLLSLGAVVTVLAAVLGTTVLANGAGADPIPAGETTIQVDGVFSFTVLGTPTPVPFTAQLVGESDGAGTVTFQIADIDFPDVAVDLLGNPATVEINATTVWTADIDPDSGIMTLTGTLTTLIDVAGLGAFNCGLGPITPELSTENTDGEPYTPSGESATAVVSDELFGIPNATNPSSTCAIAGLIDTALALPIAAGNANPARYIKGELAIFPPGAVVPTTTTVPLPAPDPTVDLPGGPVVPGGKLAVSGSGWMPGTTVTISMAGVHLRNATVDDNGNFSTEVTIPSGLADGEYTLAVAGTDADGNPRTVNSTITVESGADALPATGGDASPWVLVGATMLLAGVGLVAPRRRRLRLRSCATPRGGDAPGASAR